MDIEISHAGIKYWTDWNTERAFQQMTVEPGLKFAYCDEKQNLISIDYINKNIRVAKMSAKAGEIPLENI